jgi:hypothetical protein
MALRKPRACLSVVRLEPGDEARLGDYSQKPRALVRVSFIFKEIFATSALDDKAIQYDKYHSFSMRIVLLWNEKQQTP